MIPADIYERYHGFNNPYREILIEGNDVVAYEYSDQIPAWNLEYFYSEEGYPVDLIRQSISKSESRGYYSFYYLCSADDFQQHINTIAAIDPRYEMIIEEKIPSNEKSINTLFWDWICKTLSRPDDTLVILHILPKQYRP